MLNDLDANEKHSQLELLNDSDPVAYDFEKFPQKISSFSELFSAHGREVRGIPFHMDFDRYWQIEKEGRLVWVVARSKNRGVPVGYSCHYWFSDLHFDQTVAMDDIWFVIPSYRQRGVGKILKQMGHQRLRYFRARRTTDNIRMSFDHPNLMKELGFKPAGTRWVKTL